MKPSVLRLVVALMAAGWLTGEPAAAQDVISARSGLVHYATGKVYLDDKPVSPKFGQFPQMEAQSVLRTERGRAEVLLSPGSILRLSDASAVRLLSTDVQAPDLELISGIFLLECMEIPRKSWIRLRHQDTAIEIRKPGLYRLDSATGEFRTFEGRAVLQQADRMVEVKKGRKVNLLALGQPVKFDRKREVDSFHTWSSYRSYDIARASFSSASRMYGSGLLWRAGGWVWDPFFSTFTYVPYSGILMSPFGWQFWSPRGYYYAVVMPRYESPVGGGGWNRDLGYVTIPRTSAGTSGTVAAAGSPGGGADRGGGSAPIARDPGGGGGRGR